MLFLKDLRRLKMNQTAKITESFVSQTVVGGKEDGRFLTGTVTVTNAGVEIGNFSTDLLDNQGSVKYNKDVDNLTVFQMENKNANLDS
jgi:hypothetical protein